MSKLSLNFVIDILLFLCLSVIVGIGFLIKYVLLTGQETWAKYGENVSLEFLGMDRHEWGYIHLIIGFLMLILMVLHIVFHWQLIMAMFRKVIGISLLKTASAIVFILVCLLLILGSFFVSPVISKHQKNKDHHKFENRKHHKGRGQNYSHFDY